MAGSWVTGRQNDRWGAMVTVSAGPPWWAWKVRMWWRIARVRKKLGSKPKKLTALSTIGFARWSMLYRVPSGVSKGEARPLRRPFVLFETNFNGDSDQYLESFALVVPKAMNRVWNRAYDVPNVKRVSEWLARVNKEKQPIAAYYCAYPGATVKMIRSALALQRLLAEFRDEVPAMSAKQFEVKFRGLLAGVQRIRNPDSTTEAAPTGRITTLVPVLADHKAQLHQTLGALANPPAEMPDKTHFARWCVIDHLKLPRGYEVDPTSYLLFSSWFDGDAVEYLKALFNKIGATRAKHIWSACDFTGDDAEAFASFLLRYEVDPGSEFAGYDRVTVEKVLAALDVSERFHKFAVDSQSASKKTLSLKDAWLSDPVLKG
jgi:hypothetical protein